MIIRAATRGCLPRVHTAAASPHRRHRTSPFHWSLRLSRQGGAGPERSVPDGTCLRPGRSVAWAPVRMAANDDREDAPQADPVVQYVVLRRDLWVEMGWPLGSTVAQACHASTAVLWQFKDDSVTQQYCAPENLDHMHKVVLECKGEVQLRNLATKLTEAGVAHKLWVEQPEDFATALATKPYRKSEVQQHFKKLKLCKGI